MVRNSDYEPNENENLKLRETCEKAKISQSIETCK